MAYEGKLECFPGVVAAGDLSSDQFKFMTLATGTAALNTTAGAFVDGVLQDAPSVAGRAAAVAYDGITKVKAGAVVAIGAKIMSDATGRAITAADVATSATKACSAETYALVPGDTIVVDVDNVGNATATWDAAGATITDTTAYAVADQDTLTSVVTLTGGPFDALAQTVTFSGATTTAASIAAQMNLQLSGCSVDVIGGQVVITHDTAGTVSAIVVAAGTGGLTWAAPAAGTGDVANIKAVTAAEIETVIEADTTALVSVATGVPTITSPTTGITSELDFISGLALTKLGLAVATHVGSASDSTIRGRALEAATAAGEIITMTLAPTGKV